MMNLFIRVTFSLLVINILLSPCDGYRGYDGRSYVEKANGYRDPAKPKTLIGTSSGLPSQNTTRRGLGISAWGIVLIILTIIFAGMGVYYFAVCYPILCKKSRKYDMIGLPTVA